MLLVEQYRFNRHFDSERRSHKVEDEYDVIDSIRPNELVLITMNDRKKGVLIRVPADELATWRVHATEDNRSVSSWIRTVVNRVVKEQSATTK